MNLHKNNNQTPMREFVAGWHGLLKRPCRSRAFSLVEVLIAMGIFAVGFVAVAAMFPAGAILQRETVSQVEAQLVARNAAAIVRSSRVLFSTDGTKNPDLLGGLESSKGGSGSVDLEPLSQVFNAGNGKKIQTRFKVGDRSYPTAQKTANDRKYYWVPFIRKSKDVSSNKSDWSVVVFVLRREASHQYEHAAGRLLNGTSPPGLAWANLADDTGFTGNPIPKVVGVTATVTSPNRFVFNNRLFAQTGAGLPDQVRPGDFVADNNGNVYNVIDADATGCTIVGGIASTKAPGTIKLWYAPPPAPSTASPCVRILLLSGIVEDAQ